MLPLWQYDLQTWELTSTGTLMPNSTSLPFFLTFCLAICIVRLAVHSVVHEQAINFPALIMEENGGIVHLQLALETACFPSHHLWLKTNCLQHVQVSLLTPLHKEFSSILILPAFGHRTTNLPLKALFMPFISISKTLQELLQNSWHCILSAQIHHFSNSNIFCLYSMLAFPPQISSASSCYGLS